MEDWSPQLLEKRKEELSSALINVNLLTQTLSLLVRHLTQSSTALKHTDTETESLSWLSKQLGGIFVKPNIGYNSPFSSPGLRKNKQTNKKNNDLWFKHQNKAKIQALTKRVQIIADNAQN